MIFDNLGATLKHERVRAAVFVGALSAVVVWASAQFLQPAPPHRIVLASGSESGIYHQYARRYVEILARHGVTVEERMTNGAGDNLQLLLDPNSGVDVAFMQGGVATMPAADGLVMLASLYYEPLWIFYRDSRTLSQINELHGKRIAVGIGGSGTRAFVEQILAANGLTPANGMGRDNTEMVAIGGSDALRALKAGAVDAAFFVGGAQTPTIQQALRDPVVELMNLASADAYPRRFPFITKLRLPSGTVDLGRNIPDREVQMIGTKAMLIARDELHSALIGLFIDAAREIHSEQGYFEAAGEFPGTAPVDLRVSAYADQHARFGSRFLYRLLPFRVATFVERAIILLVPLLVVLIPLLNFLLNFFRWRVRSRIFRWYGELALLEHDVRTREGKLPVEKWLRDLDRIERSVEGIKTPTSFASEAYTLREHVDLARRAIMAKAGTAATVT